MVLIRLGVVFSVLLLAACDRPPDVFPPPEQRHPVVAYNPAPEAMMVEMSDPDAALHIVKDIYGQSDPSWRWTAQNPTVKLLVLSTEHLRLHSDFAIWDTGFKSTGPLEISFLVNGRVLDKIRYTTPGVKQFDAPVPPDWLAPDADTTLAMSLDKIYVAPKDGARFGVILVRLGLKQ